MKFRSYCNSFKYLDKISLCNPFTLLSAYLILEMEGLRGGGGVAPGSSLTRGTVLCLRKKEKGDSLTNG